MTLENWATTVLGAALLFIATITKSALDRLKGDNEKLTNRLADMHDRLSKVELTTVNEQKVREIVNDAVNPIRKGNDRIERTLRKIELEIAAMTGNHSNSTGGDVDE